MSSRIAVCGQAPVSTATDPFRVEDARGAQDIRASSSV